MKLFNDDMQVATVGNFQFSGARPEKLGATEYTLATMVTDRTGSVRSFAASLQKMKQTVVETCEKSPRRDFLMLRDVEFSSGSEEMHGFAELRMIDPTQYKEPNCGGMTALYDATKQAVEATNAYAKMLADQDFLVNAVVVVITDGSDNDSSYGPSNVAAAIREGVENEYLESINVILVGINAAQYRKELEAFKNDAGLTQYVDVSDATPQQLAKLAGFISQSISSQSQSLGTGGPSKALVF